MHKERHTRMNAAMTLSDTHWMRQWPRRFSVDFLFSSPLSSEKLASKSICQISTVAFSWLRQKYCSSTRSSRCCLENAFGGIVDSYLPDDIS